jgi:hypothetical protein
VERVEVRGLGRVDVDVVVLDRGDDGDFRSIVPELGRFLEEGGIVFIPSTTNARARSDFSACTNGSRLVLIGVTFRRNAESSTWRRAKARLEVLRKTADEETGPLACLIQ